MADHIHSTKIHSPADFDPDFLKHLSDAIKKIRFGSIEIVIHDSRIVQIEKREKIRFEKKY